MERRYVLFLLIISFSLYAVYHHSFRPRAEIVAEAARRIRRQRNAGTSIYLSSNELSAMAAHLFDTDTKVRRNALSVFHYIARESDNEVLERLLEDDFLPTTMAALRCEVYAEERASAVYALERLIEQGGDGERERVMAAVERALHEENSSVVQSMIHSLSRLSWQSPLREITKNAVFSAITSLLRDPDAAMREKGLEALEHSIKEGHRAVGALFVQNDLLAVVIAALRNDEDKKVRWRASCVLEKVAHFADSAIRKLLMDDDVLPALITSLRDEDRYVRSSAMRALSSLAQHGDGAVSQKLIEDTVLSEIVAALQDQENETVRQNAMDVMRSLARYGDESIHKRLIKDTVLSAIVNTLHDQYDLARSSTLSTLLYLGLQDGATILTTALRTEDKAIRMEAMHWLSMVARNRDEKVRKTALAALTTALRAEEKSVRDDMASKIASSAFFDEVSKAFSAELHEALAASRTAS